VQQRWPGQQRAVADRVRNNDDDETVTMVMKLYDVPHIYSCNIVKVSYWFIVSHFCIAEIRWSEHMAESEYLLGDWLLVRQQAAHNEMNSE